MAIEVAVDIVILVAGVVTLLFAVRVWRRKRGSLARTEQLIASIDAVNNILKS